ncbi:MAG: succinylglutamate desuccinylase/aspartoacylase family protein [Bacteroidota bacterium]
MDRLIASVEGSLDGPLMILVGGIHGNEISGVRAAEDVLNTLVLNSIPLRGRIVGIRGNLQALKIDKRFIDHDLNRSWGEKAVQKAFENPHETAENREVLEILNFFSSMPARGHDPKILVDLHSTSSEKGDFIIIPEDESKNPIVKALSLPIIIDLNKHLEGTLLQYMHERGYISFAFEGGAVGSDEAHPLHVSGIWELLHATGMISLETRNVYSRYDQYITEHHLHLPKRVSVLYHHKVRPEHGFMMKPGYHNFMSVKKGDILARDVHGEIKAVHDGMIFMPLYQNEGDDGFFIVTEVE